MHRALCIAGCLACLFLAVGLNQPNAAPAAETSLVTTAPFRVELLEGIPNKPRWDLEFAWTTELYQSESLAFVGLPRKYSPRGVAVDRWTPFLLRASGTITPEAGEHRILLRSRGAARLYLDGCLVLETPFPRPNADGHEGVPPLPEAVEPGVRIAPPGHSDKWTAFEFTGTSYEIVLEVLVATDGLRPEVGELAVALAPADGPFQVPGVRPFELADEPWTAFAERSHRQRHAGDADRRRIAAAEEDAYWAFRHEWARIAATPRASIPLGNEANPIDRFLRVRQEAAGLNPLPQIDDHSFLRRLSLDTTGVIPTPEEIRAFEADPPSERRARAVERKLADPRWAGHWVSYWQDVLAENPSILKPTLNNTGPFRWWLAEALEDNLAMDRFASLLVEHEGSTWYGGTSGFSVATENDAPLAAKAQVLVKAFLGEDLKCARCHDSPYHPFKQRDTFQLAAMLAGQSQRLPGSSTVPVRPGGRVPLVEISLSAGDEITPAWPSSALGRSEVPLDLVRRVGDVREEFALRMTGPANDRFARVVVNRLWQRWMGWGLVEPVDDWQGAIPSHPELLDWLAAELVTHDYDLKHAARLILTSNAYARVPVGKDVAAPAPYERLFLGPARRRMSAEQVVDSAFLAAGKEFRSEELNFDVDGRRPVSQFLNLGLPKRAWELASLSNERDRPALSLPVAQSIVDLLCAFGWRESRSNAISVREDPATVLQPLILANGTVGARISGLSDDHALTEICLAAETPEVLIDEAFLRYLSRRPTETEREQQADVIRPGFDRRVVTEAKVAVPPSRGTTVSWSNHLSPEATRIKLEMERMARAADPPTSRLVEDWRERMEDVLWTLVNSPEFVFVP
jgi:hypothetical protein